MSNKSNYEIGSQVTVKVQGEMVTATYAGWSDKYNMAIVEVGGSRMYRKIQDEGRGSVRTAAPVVMKKSRFDINTRFEFIEEVVDMVVKGNSKSVIISGDGGLGKTYTVMESLAAHKLTAADMIDAATAEENDEESTRAAGDYVVIKGFITSRALYELLYTNSDRLIIFDDCDSVWEVPTSVSLLKSALDSYERRVLTWLTSMSNPEIPRQFEFTGKIIFISNLHLAELDQAVLSRCLYVDVSMTPEEKIERIRYISPRVCTDMKKSEKEEVIDLLNEVRDQIGDLNIRTFLKACEIRQRGAKNWRDLAEYVVTAF
jgi:hypothetical protein